LLEANTRRSTFGSRLEKSARRGISQRAVNTGGAVITSSASLPRSRISSTAAASASKPSRIFGRQARAASVSCTPRALRRNNCTPRYSSRLFTWWLTAACVMCSSTAASLKERWRAAASNTRNAFKGGRR
jgi:hypothetical protein